MQKRYCDLVHEMFNVPPPAPRPAAERVKGPTTSATMGTDDTTSGTPDRAGRRAGAVGGMGTEGEPHLDHHVEELLVALNDLSHNAADGHPGAETPPPGA